MSTTPAMECAILFRKKTYIIVPELLYPFQTNISTQLSLKNSFCVRSINAEMVLTGIDLKYLTVIESNQIYLVSCPWAYIKDWLINPLTVDGTFLEFLYKIWRTGVLYYQTDRLKGFFEKIMWRMWRRGDMKI